MAIFQYNSAAGAGITLAHVGRGVPVFIDILNGTAAAFSYYVNVTDPAGTAMAGTYWIWTNAQTGSNALRMDSGGALPALTAGYRFVAFGQIMEGYFFFK
jgi:hypothetical protein